jgi:TatD DNase family protein
MDIHFIDTHTHLDGEEFKEDLAEVIARAKEAGVSKVFLPGIDLNSVETVMNVCRQYPDYAYPMIGLQPEEVKADYNTVLDSMEKSLEENLASKDSIKYIAVGEVGLDYYWSREFEKEQLDAFERQIRWSIKYNLPLSIHCRKAQNEMVKILRKYEDELPGGIFHCFTGNEHEAKELLSFEKFVLGIGGVLTFKSSHLREMLPANVPLSRIVLETDSPYMAPVPNRGQRNESAFVAFVLKQLAESYGVSEKEVAETTNANVKRVFNI